MRFWEYIKDADAMGVDGDLSGTGSFVSNDCYFNRLYETQKIL